MIRFILAILVAGLYLLFTLPVLLYLRLFHGHDRDAQIRISKPMIQWVFRMFIFFSGIHLDVYGKENIPKDRAVLFAANHRGIFDVITSYPEMERPTCFVAKSSLKKYPLFSDWFSFIGSLYFDRSNLKEGVQMLKDAMRLIEEGKSVFLFPEGTRNRGAELPLLEFHEGSFRIATRTGCPIVPVAIHNMDAVFEKQIPRLKPVSVSIEFGEPIDPTVFSKSEQKHLGEQVSARITQMLTARYP